MIKLLKNNYFNEDVVGVNLLILYEQFNKHKDGIRLESAISYF